VSRTDTTDPARGWLYAEGLLLEDEIARLETMGTEPLDAELRAVGIDPERVPSLEELLARAAALAKTKEERGEVDHARGWAHMESLLAKDDPAPAADSVPLRARAREAALAAKTGASLPRLPAVWLAAAVVGAVLLVFAFMNGAAIVAVFKGEAIRPDDEWLPWERAPTREERAASLREKAFAACDVAQWDPCQAKLDEARGIDPAGEEAPRVAAARSAIAAATRTPAPPLKEDPLKPPLVP